MTSINPTMLDWIAGEIRESLQAARQALTDYSHDVEDVTHLRFAATHLHQVEGALFMAELEPAAKLMNEAGALLHAQVEKAVLPNDQFNTVLGESISTLETWLEEARQEGEHAQTGKLLDTTNELRSLIGKSPIQATGFADLDFSAYPLSPVDPDHTVADISELHRQFQQALVHWLKDPSDNSPLGNLSGVLEKLEGETRMPEVGCLWATTDALVEMLAAAGANGQPQARRLLGEAERRIKIVADSGESSLSREETGALIEAMLSQLRGKDNPGEKERALYENLGLSDASQVGAPNHQQELSAIRELGPKVETEIAGIRYFIDDYIDPAAKENSSWAAVAEQLQSLEKSAGVAGASTLEELLSSLRQACEAAESESDLLPETFGVNIATGLVLAESAAHEASVDFEGWCGRVRQAIDLLQGSGVDEDNLSLTTTRLHEDALKSVGSEIRASLRDVEGAFKLYEDQRQDGSLLTRAEKSLAEVGGALNLISQPLLAQLTEETRRAVSALRDGVLIPTDRLLEAIAMACGTLETCVLGLDDERIEIDALALSASADLETAIKSNDQAETEPAESVAHIGRLLGMWMEHPENTGNHQQLMVELQAPWLERYAHDRDVIVKLVQAANAENGLAGEDLARELHQAFETISQDVLVTGAAQQPAPNGGDSQVSSREAETFIDEASVGLAQLRDYLKEEDFGPGFKAIPQVLDSLAGASAAIGLKDLSQSSMDLESLLRHGAGGNVTVENPQQTIAEYADIVAELVRVLQEGGTPSTVEDRFRDYGSRLRERMLLTNANVTAQQSDSSGDDEIDLSDVFKQEALQLLSDAATQVREMEADPASVGPRQQLVRALHTLKGGARITERADIAQLAQAAEQALSRSLEAIGEPVDELAVLMRKVTGQLGEMLSAVENEVDIRDLSAALDRILPRRPGGSAEAPSDDPASLNAAEPNEEPAYDPEVREIFLQEAADLLSGLSPLLSRIGQGDESGKKAMAEIRRVFHTLKGGARTSGLDSLGDIAHAVESYLQTSLGSAQAPDAAITDLLQDIGDELAVAVDAIASGSEPSLKQVEDRVDRLASLTASAGKGHESPQSSQPAAKGPDPEVRAIFLEEASDLLSGMTPLLQQLGDGDEQSGQELPEIRRVFHTIKGGARMSGLERLGDLAHRLESFLQDRLQREELPGKETIEQLQAISDEMLVVVETLVEGGEPSMELLEKTIDRLSGSAFYKEKPVSAKPAKTRVEPAQKSKALLAEPPVISEEDAQDEPELPMELAGRAGTVRVTTAILDVLVSYASEIGISRSRMRQEFGSFGGLVTEMRDVVERFQRYIRDFEIEAESSVLTNPVQKTIPSAQSESEFDPHNLDHYSRFDPLELDRYSRLQQLTRSLSECVDDMVSIESGMERVAWEAESLFQHDARLHSDLHQQLLQTRMQPLSVLSGRLRHLVRTISDELGKKVELELLGADVELDRSIIERMAAPLEHMVRNAIDHGIEPPEQRLKAGKAEVGKLVVEFRQAYNEVIMRFSDDGAGINLERLREKAIAAGRADEATDDRALMRLILEAGISTAEKVTQVSGRGIGMDVVASEVRYLGGQVDVESEPGKGTMVSVRLPLSLSITRATVVISSGQVFALPQSSISEVASITAQEAEDLLSQENPVIHHNNEDYAWSRLCDRMDIPATVEDLQDVPVVFLHSGRRRIALAVEAVNDTEDLIVKPLNPQLSGVPRITGASVTSDGSIALLLDPGELRRDTELEQDAEPVRPYIAVPATDRSLNTSITNGSGKFIMVVDDSVTVRKVTGRLMERHGYRVALARDGLEALEMVKEQRPDLMLLDIEMPNMDGYELLAHIRSQTQTAAIPVIMISSRSGEKHRIRAKELGANDYFSKPYEDALLVDRVAELLVRNGD